MDKLSKTSLNYYLSEYLEDLKRAGVQEVWRGAMRQDAPVPNREASAPPARRRLVPPPAPVPQAPKAPAPAPRVASANILPMADRPAANPDCAARDEQLKAIDRRTLRRDSDGNEELPRRSGSDRPRSRQDEPRTRDRTLQRVYARSDQALPRRRYEILHDGRPRQLRNGRSKLHRQLRRKIPKVIRLRSNPLSSRLLRRGRVESRRLRSLPLGLETLYRG